MDAQTSSINALLRGSTLIGSTISKKWTAIGIERRHLDAVPRPEEDLDSHYVILWGNKPTIADREYRAGKFQRVIKPPRTLSLGTAGRLPATRAITPYDVTACVIKTHAADALAEEMEMKNTVCLRDHLAITDEPLTHLIHLAAIEGSSANDTGSLYRESIEQALIARFIRLANSNSTRQTSVSPLPKTMVHRVIDKLSQEYETDIRLADLARDAGYSRSHFHKMFHLATGQTPFECLRDIRLEAARRGLLETKETIATIAARVGFSSHSHLTRFFAQKYGVSPSEFRRINS